MWSLQGKPAACEVSAFISYEDVAKMPRWSGLGWPQRAVLLDEVNLLTERD
jgi:hypothetical protein